MNIHGSPFPLSAGIRILPSNSQAACDEWNWRLPDVRLTTGTANPNARTTNARRFDENSVFLCSWHCDQRLANEPRLFDDHPVMKQIDKAGQLVRQQDRDQGAA